jgi:CRP-like cAMP-binding protein
VVALMVSGAGGEQAGVRAVGAEGMAGIGALIGSLRSEVSVVQQVAGAVASCPTQALRRSQEQHPEVARLVLRYASYALRVAQQTVACNVLHTARQRAARWILCTADRKGREEFDLTQDLLAQMLGVTRQFTSGITAELRADGVIAYHRGALRILKRDVLQRRACDCYQVMQGMLRELQDR